MKRFVVALIAAAMLMLIPLELAESRGGRRGGGMHRGSDRAGRLRRRRSDKDRQKLVERTRAENRRAALDRLRDARD